MARSSGRSSARSSSSGRPSTSSSSSSSHHRTSVPAAPPAPAPPAVQHAPAPQQPSLFANMASTAAGVAVGSAVGHTIGAGLTGLFGGGGSSNHTPAPQEAPVAPQPQQAPLPPMAGACDSDQKAFTRCLDANSNDITACQFYFDMLKQCQASNAPY